MLLQVSSKHHMYEITIIITRLYRYHYRFMFSIARATPITKIVPTVWRWPTLCIIMAQFHVAHFVHQTPTRYQRPFRWVVFKADGKHFLIFQCPKEFGKCISNDIILSQVIKTLINWSHGKCRISSVFLHCSFPTLYSSASQPLESISRRRAFQDNPWFLYGHEATVIAPIPLTLADFVKDTLVESRKLPDIFFMIPDKNWE